MAHGTGLYWIRNYKADLKTKEYAAIFSQTRNYYFEPMSDCIEPTWENLDEYEVTVLKWRKDRWGHMVADHLSEGYRTGTINKDEANKIWWNIKNRSISFRECREYFKEIAGKEITN